MLTEIETRLSRHRTLRARLMLLSVAVLAAIPAGALLAQNAPVRAASAPFTVVQTGQGFDRLQDAINSLGEGDGTIRVAPGTWHDCGVQPHGNVAYIAAIPGQSIFDGKVCEEKAALVMRGQSMRVEGLIFQNMRAFDANGAGIRLERGDLTVRDAWFRDSEQGILSANFPAGHVVIEQSTLDRKSVV